MSTYSTDPALYIYTSLTAGSSHIVTATSRLETILRANRIPFKAVDIATDEKARMLWGRRAGKDQTGRKRKMPALVQEGLVLGDIVEIEDWNEYGELKQHVKIYYDEHTIPDIHHKHPTPKIRRPVQKASAAAAAGAANATPKSAPAGDADASSSSPATGAPIPPAPGPAPEPGQLKPAPMPASKDEPKPEAPKQAEKKKEEVLPMRSVADEAAAKAKELRLKSLREKVHGKKGAEGGKAADEPDAAKKPGDDGDAAAPDGKKTIDVEAARGAGEALLPTLQSPGSGRWRQDGAGEQGPAADVQSPRSGTWKMAVRGGPPPAKEEEEDDDDDDEDEDEDDSEEDDDDEEEEDDDDDDDDDDEDDDDDDDDEFEDATEGKKADEKPSTTK